MENKRGNFINRCIKIIKEKGLMGFFKKIESRHFDPFRVIFYPYALFRLPYVKKQNFTPESLVHFTLNKWGGFIKPAQFESEITNLVKVFKDLEPKIILEIGTSTGGTFFMWSRMAPKDARLISIDLPGGESNWAYPTWKEGFYKKFASDNQKIELLRGDSHDLQMVEKIKNILGDNKIDFMFIDGDHSYDGVKKDYELYSPFIKKGGVIAFHDIIKFPDYTKVEVDKFWNEIKENKQFKEFIDGNKDQKWGGIGVLFL